MKIAKEAFRLPASSFTCSYSRPPDLTHLRFTAFTKLTIFTFLQNNPTTFPSAVRSIFVAAGTFGSQNPTRNLAPTAVWVIWWVGVAYLSAPFGNVWMILNPWSALFSIVERSVGLERRFMYPPALGVWPDAALDVGLARTAAWLLRRTGAAPLA